MPNLVIYVPFPRATPPGQNSDLRNNAAELAAAPLAGFAIGGAAINAVVDVFWGEEGANQVAGGDILCVHAHGSDGTATTVTDNVGNATTLANLLVNLGTLGATNAVAIYFFVCFSAKNNHIGAAWHAAHGAQAVYGTTKMAEGGIIYTTRTSIRSSIFDANNWQLDQL